MARNPHPAARRRTHAEKAARSWAAASRSVAAAQRHEESGNTAAAARSWAFSSLCVAAAQRHEAAAQRAGQDPRPAGVAAALA